MQDIFRVLARLMQTDLTVMISGESGTGKELVARALHDYGKRKGGPFVAINMAAIPRDLIESELFGHEKGAFTGAAARSVGRFEQADGGTLFLDEIGDMPMEAQTRLLRVLQQGEYTTVGGRRRSRPTCASSRRPTRICASRSSRARFARTCFSGSTWCRSAFRRCASARRTFPISCAPSSSAARRRACRRRRSSRRRWSAAGYPWPETCANWKTWRAASPRFTPGVIGEALIEAELGAAARRLLAPAGRRRTRQAARQRRGARIAGEGFDAAVERAVAELFRSFGGASPPAGLYHRVLHDLEAPLIAATLAVTRGNQIKAAEILGLNRNTLRKKIRDLNLRGAASFR